MIFDGVEYNEIELSIDGDHAIAKIGPNLQEGLAATVQFKGKSNIAKIVAAKKALHNLQKTVGRLPHKYHSSHPFYTE